MRAGGMDVEVRLRLGLDLEVGDERERDLRRRGGLAQRQLSRRPVQGGDRARRLHLLPRRQQRGGRIVEVGDLLHDLLRRPDPADDGDRADPDVDRHVDRHLVEVVDQRIEHEAAGFGRVVVRAGPPVGDPHPLVAVRSGHERVRSPHGRRERGGDQVGRREVEERPLEAGHLRQRELVAPQVDGLVEHELVQGLDALALCSPDERAQVRLDPGSGRLRPAVRVDAALPLLDFGDEHRLARLPPPGEVGLHLGGDHVDRVVRVHPHDVRAVGRRPRVAEREVLEEHGLPERDREPVGVHVGRDAPGDLAELAQRGALCGDRRLDVEVRRRPQRGVHAPGPGAGERPWVVLGVLLADERERLRLVARLLFDDGQQLVQLGGRARRGGTEDQRGAEVERPHGRVVQGGRPEVPLVRWRAVQRLLHLLDVRDLVVAVHLLPEPLVVGGAEVSGRRSVLAGQPARHGAVARARAQRADRRRARVDRAGGQVGHGCHGRLSRALDPESLDPIACAGDVPAILLGLRARRHHPSGGSSNGRVRPTTACPPGSFHPGCSRSHHHTPRWSRVRRRVA